MGLDWHNATVATAMLAMARLAGLMVFMPALAHRAIPWRLRWLIAAGLTVGVLARQGAVAPPASAPAMLVSLVCEVALGMLAGLLANLLLVGVQVAAGQIGQQVGISLIASYDASGEAGSDSIGQLMTLLAVVVFLACGAHRVVLGGLVGSPLAVAPSGGAEAWLATLTGMLAQAFVLAVRLAGPVLAVMLVVSAALGVLQRSAPQMHVFSIGLVARAVAGLLALSVALVGLVRLVEAFAGVLDRGLRAVTG